MGKKHHYTDTTSFRPVFEKHYPGLMRLACRYVDEAAAKDLVQDVFVAYWEKQADLEIGNIASFLFRSVQNKCLDHIRHRMVVQEYEAKVRIAEARAEFIDRTTDANETLDFVFNQDLLSIIRQSVDKLPPKCREAFELSFFNDLTYREIAEQMQISPRTAETHVHKAIAFLRDDLKHLSWFCFLLDLLP